MVTFIKKNKWIFAVFFACLTLGILTFFVFIDQNFIKFKNIDLQLLLIADLVLVLIFFLLILKQIFTITRGQNNKGISSKANTRYVAFFSIATLFPSILIAIFSLILFSVTLEKYLDKKITTAVNNSYDIAKNYVDEVRNVIEADILLVALDVNRQVNIFYDNPNYFKNLLRNQRLLRRLDEIHIIDGSGKQIISSVADVALEYLPPQEKAFELLSAENRPIKITDAITNRSSALLKLNNYIDTYLYIVKFLDPKIINYLKETEQAINFYYTVENKRTGIKITFALIYILVVTLLLFLSITIALRFASSFFKPISNLISASENISAGNLDTKVPLIESDEAITQLNKNFNLMIDRLKFQQEKLLSAERHEAWENVARKLAHEIKNPLTPIQLSIDRLREKYLKEISNDKENFEKYLKTINKQIKDIEKLVDEFSDFARMPKPILQKIDLKEIINNNLDLVNLSNQDIIFNFSSKIKNTYINADQEQLNRVFINLIKNSIESLQEKSKKDGDFTKKIDIDIREKSNYIICRIDDNGSGFSKVDLNRIVKPYFTTKTYGTGLGLAIVNKIINDHEGKINFLTLSSGGARVEIILPKNVN